MNALTRIPLSPTLMRMVLGIARKRAIPLLAPEPFVAWFARRPLVNEGASEVLVWPDTFNNYLQPETTRAAVEVLEALGRRVILRDRPLCCGRPLYDFGMLDEAKARLRGVLDALRPSIRAGVPLVGLEPSCVAVFRDELVNLFPEDEDAQRLARQTYLFTEYLAKHPHPELPRLAGRSAVVHGHCHAKALGLDEGEEDILASMSLDVEMLDVGCCGLAGSFGYEAEKYDVSMRVSELALLPAVRKADRAALVVADGFSCRTQIEHATGRKAWHAAEVIRTALGEVPSRGALARPRWTVLDRSAVIAAAVAITALGAVIVAKRVVRT